MTKIKVQLYSLNSAITILSYHLKNVTISFILFLTIDFFSKDGNNLFLPRPENENFKRSQISKKLIAVKVCYEQMLADHMI